MKEDISHENAMRIVQINLVGVLNGIYAALPLLKATPNALCFTTSSSSATYGMPTLAWFDRIKGISPEFLRKRLVKMFLMAPAQKK